MHTSTCTRTGLTVSRSGTSRSYLGPLFLCAAIGLAAAPLQAATVRGTVASEATERYLERAVVRVEGTNIRAMTEKDGSFVLSGLPAGTHTLVATYTDLDSVSRTVTVGQDETATANFELGSQVFELDAVNVTTYLEGVSFAQHQQREADSIRTVTSVDTFIDTVTGNPGEFLKNLQGIQMDYSQNEPNRIRIRGIDPNLTTITMDGNEIAGAASSGTNRALEIDQLTISGIRDVEVYKAPIPSMSANAIGGLVNFQTKSAFDVKGQRASITLGVNTESHDFFGTSDGPGHGDKAERRLYPIGRFEYTNSFLDNRLGVFFTVGRDHTNQLGSSMDASFRSYREPRNGGTIPAAPEQLTVDDVVLHRNGLAVAPNRQLRTRTDGTLNLDFKVSDNLTAYLKMTHNDYHSTNRNHAFAIRPTGEDDFNAEADWDVYTVTGGTAAQGVSVFEKRTKTTQINAGVRFIDENWKIDYNIANSTSRNTYDNPWHFSSLSIGLSDIDFSIGHKASAEVPTVVNQLGGPSFYQLNNYYPNQGNLLESGGEQRSNHNGFVRKRARDTTEDRLTTKLDVRRYFNGENRFYLQTGFSYNETERDINRGEEHYYWMGDDGVASPDDYTAEANLGRFKESPAVTTQLSDAGHIREPEYFDTNALQLYWEANPQVLALNEARTMDIYLANRKNIREKILGYYFMGNFTLEKLNVMTGVRIEDTDIEGWGPRSLPTYDSTLGETSPSPEAVDLRGADPNSLEGVMLRRSFKSLSSGYTSDPFPYLHLKYDWTPRFLTRLSYTESIGRPNFSDLIPNISENPDLLNPSLSIQNAGLEPQRSDNIDFSAEFYGDRGTEFTVGWFSRDIVDFIESETLEDATAAQLAQFNLGPEYVGYDINTTRNIGSAKWSGFELSARQSFRQFDNLPQFLRQFEVFGNYTKIDKMEKDLGDGRLRNHINNVIPEQYTAGLTYRSGNGKLLLRLSQNYQGVRVNDDLPVVSSSQQDRSQQERYEFLNFESSYQINDRTKAIFLARNLGEERQVITHYGVVTNQRQDTGVAYTMSVQFDL